MLRGKTCQQPIAILRGYTYSETRARRAVCQLLCQETGAPGLRFTVRATTPGAYSLAVQGGSYMSADQQLPDPPVPQDIDKPMALHGFPLCSDGRLYHLVLAEMALDEVGDGHV